MPKEVIASCILWRGILKKCGGVISEDGGRYDNAIWGVLERMCCSGILLPSPSVRPSFSIYRLPQRLRRKSSSPPSLTSLCPSFSVPSSPPPLRPPSPAFSVHRPPQHFRRKLSSSASAKPHPPPLSLSRSSPFSITAYPHPYFLLL
ncbi:hypothetical protein ACLOJK_001414 [Asimina triloba]